MIFITLVAVQALSAHVPKTISGPHAKTPDRSAAVNFNGAVQDVEPGEASHPIEKVPGMQGSVYGVSDVAPAAYSGEHQGAFADMMSVTKVQQPAPETATRTKGVEVHGVSDVAPAAYSSKHRGAFADMMSVTKTLMSVTKVPEDWEDPEGLEEKAVRARPSNTKVSASPHASLADVRKDTDDLEQAESRASRPGDKSMAVIAVTVVACVGLLVLLWCHLHATQGTKSENYSLQKAPTNAEYLTEEDRPRLQRRTTHMARITHHGRPPIPDEFFDDEDIDAPPAD